MVQLLLKANSNTKAKSQTYGTQILATSSPLTFISKVAYFQYSDEFFQYYYLVSLVFNLMVRVF